MSEKKIQWMPTMFPVSDKARAMIPDIKSEMMSEQEALSFCVELLNSMHYSDMAKAVNAIGNGLKIEWTQYGVTTEYHGY